MLKTWALMAALLVSGLGVGCRGDGQAAATPARVACDRVVSLCQGNAQDRAQCEAAFAQMRPGVDAENAARTARCVSEARTCGEASGCVAGGAARAGASFLRDFTNGLTR